MEQHLQGSWRAQPPDLTPYTLTIVDAQRRCTTSVCARDAARSDKCGSGNKTNTFDGHLKPSQRCRCARRDPWRVQEHRAVMAARAEYVDVVYTLKYVMCIKGWFGGLCAGRARSSPRTGSCSACVHLHSADARSFRCWGLCYVPAKFRSCIMIRLNSSICVALSICLFAGSPGIQAAEIAKYDDGPFASKGRPCCLWSIYSLI